MTLTPRVVIVTRHTTYEELLVRHATRSQAAFFLAQRGQSLDQVEALHHQIYAACATVASAIPLDWRRNQVTRSELDRFAFEPEDVVVVVGQDGLVANVAKYLSGQPVIGVNPTPEVFDGILVPHTPREGCRRLRAAAHRDVALELRTMVQVALDDGQRLCALNELFIGQRTHQTARYELCHAGRSVVHGSSGVIVTSGTGATGWARSIHVQRQSTLPLPSPTEERLAFFVREAFPSRTTSTELTEGSVDDERPLAITSRMDEGVIFGDGIESDHLSFDWGAVATFTRAPEPLNLVR